MKLIALGLVILVFLSSCATPEKKLTRVQQNDPIFSVAQKIKNSCFETKNPGFSAQMDSTKFLPQIRVEGVWKDNYQNFLMQLQDMFGEDFSTVHLKQNALKLTSKEQDANQTKELEPLLSLMSSLGSRGMRNLICGNYAFDVNSEGGFFIPKQTDTMSSIPESGKYEMVSFATFNGHKIKVRSSVNMEPKGDVTETKIESKFLYGFFSNEANVDVKWVALVKPQTVFVKSVTFLIENKTTYTLNFDDYQ